MTLHQIEIDFDKCAASLPEREGSFLCKTDLGIEVLHVKFYPPKQEFGITWGAHFGVVNRRGHDVSQFTGKFIEIIDKENDYDNK